MKLTLALVLVAATAACDRLATGSFKPPYVTIAGQIDASTATAMPKDVHIAILWQNDQSAGSNYAVEPIDVLAQFPASFRVPITEKPTPQVVNTLPATTAIGIGLDPEMSWALGTLIVFADGDGNGQLTITKPGFPQSPDRVLAADLDIFYLGSGQPAPQAFVGLFPITTGFSLVREPPQQDPKPGDCGRFTAQGHFQDLCQPTIGDSLPLDTGSYTEHMTLADDDRLDGYSCDSYWGPLEYPDFFLPPNDVCDGGGCSYCRGYQCPLDLPMAGDPVTCSADGLSYVYKRCVKHAELCGTRICHFGHGEREAVDPPPSGWPCP